MGIDEAVATGYDRLVDNEPELARTTAASVTQRIAFGERAGQKVVSRIDLATDWFSKTAFPRSVPPAP